MLSQTRVCKKQQRLCAKARYLQRVKDIVPIHSHGLMAFPPVCPAPFAHQSLILDFLFFYIFYHITLGFSSFQLESNTSDEKEKAPSMSVGCKIKSYSAVYSVPVHTFEYCYQALSCRVNTTTT